jgi:AAA+ ATPase superfamily predicted ATPase
MTDLLAQRANDTFVGREDELATLLDILDDEPRIVFLHGIAGIGKSTLLEKFAEQARVQGSVVLSLNCQAIEPTERGVLHGLSVSMGGRISTTSRAAERLKSLGPRVILSLDNYEVFRLMDVWFRQVFVPLLPGNGVVIVGRDTPQLAWLVLPGRAGL